MGSCASPGRPRPRSSTQLRSRRRHSPLPLSAADIRQFTTDGYVLVRPAQGELPPTFHDDFYSSCAEMFDIKPAGKAPGTMGSMTNQINALLRAPTCKGAMESLLGPDFMVATWGNGTPLLHAPNAEPDIDQACTCCAPILTCNMP